MKIKYSFVIPVYGCEQYLEACVESILSQKGDHAFEIILVDDGSRDRSGQIADMLARKDSRIRTFHKENGGAASARNFGLQQVTGDYVLFIDSDDTVEDQLLQCVDEALAEHPEALVIYGMTFDYYRKDVCIRSQLLSCGHNGVYSVKQLLEEGKAFFYDNALSSACNKVFQAAVLRKLGLEMQPGMTLYEDFDFVLRYLACAEQVHCIAKPFYRYRNDLEEAHLDRRVASLEKLQENMRMLFRSALELSPESTALKEVCVGLYMMLLWQHLKGKKYSIEELSSCAAAYCAEPAFRAMLVPEVHLGSFEQKLLRRIEQGEFRELQREIQKSRLKTNIKRIVKKSMRAVGMKR